MFTFWFLRIFIAFITIAAGIFSGIFALRLFDDFYVSLMLAAFGSLMCFIFLYRFFERWL